MGVFRFRSRAMADLESNEDDLTGKLVEIVTLNRMLLAAMETGLGIEYTMVRRPLLYPEVTPLLTSSDPVGGSDRRDCFVHQLSGSRFPSSSRTSR